MIKQAFGAAVLACAASSAVAANITIQNYSFENGTGYWADGTATPSDWKVQYGNSNEGSGTDPRHILGRERVGRGPKGKIPVGVLAGVESHASGDIGAVPRVRTEQQRDPFRPRWHEAR